MSEIKKMVANGAEIKKIIVNGSDGQREYGIEDSYVRQDVQEIMAGAPEELDSFREAFEAFKEGDEALAAVSAALQANTTAIADETERARAAEEKLAEDVNAAMVAVAAEKERAQGAEAAINDMVAATVEAQTAALTQAVNELNEKIDNEGENGKAALATEIDKIKDGDTIAGQAREIHSRNGKTVPDSFLARTTAGSGTIGDGVASLKSVGGNIIKNLVGDFADKNVGRIDLKEVGGYYFLSTKRTDASGDTTIRLNSLSTIVGHKYYVAFNAKSGYPISAFIKTFSSTNYLFLRKNIADYTYLSTIVTAKDVQSTILIYPYGYGGNTNIGDIAMFSHPLMIDLTEMFGAGNEPDQATCDKLFGTMDALPQGLTIANPSEFKSTGFNQFNPDNVLEGKAIVDNAIVSGDKKIAVIPCLPCKVGVGENNGYCIHGDFGDDIKVYLTPLNPMEVDGELYMHELTKDATTDTYVPLIKGYMLVEVPTTANLCAHFLWSEDKCERDSYEPYFESKVEMPDIPQMSEWGLAGIRSSGTLVCDEIDFERGVYVKRIGCVDLGSKTWGYASTNNGTKRKVSVLVNNMLIPTGSKNVANIACERYTTASGDAVYMNWNKCISLTPTHISIYDTDYLDENTVDFKAYLQGVMLYYELAEPIEYPLPKVDNNYISSDYGVEQFLGSAVPCNANNLYYMRSLAGETRNFLDRLMAGLGTSDATVVADRILAVVNHAVEPANVEPETPIEE